MTLDKFYELLNEAKPRYKWILLGHNKLIRGISKKDNLHYCPLEAVNGRKGWISAAANLKFKEKKEVKHILWGADNVAFDPFAKLQEEDLKVAREVRNKLMEILEIKN
jgi:hypothetical protein